MVWLLAMLVGATIAVLAFFPADWVASAVEQRTGGRLTLGDAQGTLWRGSAFIGGAASGNGAVTPLLPGRFAWTLSPLSLLGMVDMELSNPQALAQAVSFKGGWTQWQLSPSALLLPADGLAGLGAPLNTVAPSGRLRLSWTTLEMEDMSSRLSPLKPLGSYQLALDWRGQQAQLALRSIKGPLLLSGTGSLQNGRMQFSGQAEAADGYEQSLDNLLNLLGQRRPNSGGKNIIALEFR